jgi:hypothetical protein
MTTAVIATIAAPQMKIGGEDNQTAVDIEIAW